MSKELIEAAKAVVYSHGVDGLARGIANLRAVVDRLEAEPDVIENVDEARVEQAARAVDTLVMGERGWHWIDMCNTLRPYVLPSPAPRPSEDVRRVPIEDDEPYNDWHKEAVALAAGVIVDSEASRNAYVNGIIEGRRIAWSRRSLPAPQPGTVVVPISDIEYLKSTVSSFGVGVPGWALRAREAADAITKLLPPTPPSPPEALTETWRKEFDEWWAKPERAQMRATALHSQCYLTWMARAEAEWRGKNGGGK